MRFGITKRLQFGAAVVALSLTFGPAVASAAPTLNRSLDAYFALAQRFLRMKNFSLESPCNIGVNCPPTGQNGKTGLITFDGAFGADGSQIVANRTYCGKKPSNLWEHFTNDDTNGSCAKNTVRNPPVTTFLPPIIGDLDGDGHPSCEIDASHNAVIDYGDIEKGCGFPPDDNFTCDPSKPVTVKAGQDCLPYDTNLGNARCDLPPGTYGDLTVGNDSKTDLVGGIYRFCNVNISRRTVTTAKGTTILIPDGGSFKVNNDSVIGADCGDLAVLVKGAGTVRFGRRLSVAAKVCAPQSKVNLGDESNLLGQFIGEQVETDFDDHGHCCGGHCACIDAFSPSSGKVGDVITMTSGCNLNNATGVQICGVDAPIQSKSQAELKVKIGVGTPPGQCDVTILSAVGSFKANAKLTVQP